MYFGKQFKEYREEYLKMKQIEAAYELKIEPAALSNYERNERGFPNYLLPVVKETFNIPDDYFLAMVLGKPLKSVQEPDLPQPVKAKKLQKLYLNRFIDRHRELFEENAELRELVAVASLLNEKDRRVFLNACKSLISLYYKLIDQDESQDSSFPSP